MAWYRSIGIDTPDIVKPGMVEEYKNVIPNYSKYGDVDYSFTVINPGLYFIAAYGINILNISTTSSNPILYNMDNGGRNTDKFRLMHLDAGDVIRYTGEYANYGTTILLAIRITNADFYSVKYSNRSAAGARSTYSNEIDNMPHFIWYHAWGSVVGTDNSSISSECDFISYSYSEKSWYTGGCTTFVSNDDLVYIDAQGNNTSVVIDFVLQPISPKISGTLPAGQSTITLIDQRIRSDSHISAVYAETWYLDITVNDGSCTIEFPVQDTDMNVEIEVE